MRIALVGCGKMGSALLQGWLNNDSINKIFILDPNANNISSPKVTIFTDVQKFNDATQEVHVVVLAVKPQIFDEVLLSLKIAPDALVVSIAAGKKLESFGKNNPAARVMPNTPAAIGQGMNVAMLNKSADNADKTAVAILLKDSGTLEWVEDENLFNAVTALSGSGPAYVFLLIEIMTQAGIKQGLAPDFAAKLARQTVIGSAALAAHDDSEAATLRKNVTSPGGTTEAALKILMNGEMQKLFDDAIAAATKRGKELS